MVVLTVIFVPPGYFLLLCFLFLLGVLVHTRRFRSLLLLIEVLDLLCHVILLRKIMCGSSEKSRVPAVACGPGSSTKFIARQGHVFTTYILGYAIGMGACTAGGVTADSAKWVCN